MENRSARQHEIKKALAPIHATGVRCPPGQVQKPDPRGERGVCAQIGVLTVEPVIHKSLSDCVETAFAGRLVRDEALWR